MAKMARLTWKPKDEYEVPVLEIVSNVSRIKIPEGVVRELESLAKEIGDETAPLVKEQLALWHWREANDLRAILKSSFKQAADDEATALAALENSHPGLVSQFKKQNAMSSNAFKLTLANIGERLRLRDQW